MNYTLHQLQVFIKVVQSKSITKASEALFMSQPAVSIQLKNFQDQFEIPLTEVVGRKLYITEFGLEIYQMAEKIMNEVYAINYKTQIFKGFLSGRLSISIVSTGKYVMPYFLTNFIKQHEHIELFMDVTNKSKVIQSLENNEVDFALVSVMPEDLNLNSVTLLENHLFLVGNTKLAQNIEERNISILNKIPLIYREEGSGTRVSMENFLKKMNLNLKNKMELTSNEAVKQAVMAGLGFSIMPLIGIKYELQLGDLKIVHIPYFPIVTEWKLVWLAAKKLSPVSQAFLKFIQEEKDTIRKTNFNWISQYT